MVCPIFLFIGFKPCGFFLTLHQAVINTAVANEMNVDALLTANRKFWKFITSLSQ